MWASATGALRPSANWPRPTAKQRIDAAGKVVAPGFIDMLGQSEFTILVEPRLPSKIYQGITTEITGEGNSAAPLTGHARLESAEALEHYGLKADWQSWASTSRAWSARGWASIWLRTSELPRCARW
jgi:N-acyl-D-amino-acid deacylase